MSNLHSFFQNICHQYSDYPLFNERFTYAQTMVHVLLRAAFLQQKGIKKGEIIAILADNLANLFSSLIIWAGLGLLANSSFISA